MAVKKNIPAKKSVKVTPKTPQGTIHHADAHTVSFFMGLMIILIVCFGSIVILQRFVINIQNKRLVEFQDAAIMHYNVLESRIDNLQEQMTIILKYLQ
ncbi:MAG: hypothetical protein COU27_00300 [Candidatus Levybacteria bacterium CG10_big_fil_rev_8_21_14_0_10_36_7]|nr:MAG: hypothetical protein COU27_00300 [Candidatus Levybacteria bacterium CG10_big_fil_rev_8_21_14_0_10_36_7]